MSHNHDLTHNHDEPSCSCCCGDEAVLEQPITPAPALIHVHDDDEDDEGAPCACCSSCHADSADGDEENERNIVPLLIACGILTFLGVALHIAGVSGPILTLLVTGILLGASVVGLVIIAPAVKASVLGLNIDINILMVIAVLGAWLLGDFAEAAAVVFFFCIGEWLEDYAIDKNRSSIERLMDLTPQIVRVLQDGKLVELAPEEVVLGSTVVIRPGERVPLDGTVVSGSASLDESPITGESVPLLKQEGDTLYAGSLSVDGKLEFVTTATVKDSTLARIVALVEESQKKRTPYERFINRFARYYTPAVVVIAALVALVPTLISLLSPLDLGGITTWGYRALALLVIACPCALVIATPVSVVTGLAQAARMGVLVKGGAFLELSSKVRAIAFDKTGTLTYGKPEVTQVVVLPGAREVLGKDKETQEAILLRAAALEQNSTHPLARAVMLAAKSQGDLPVATDIVEIAGKGIGGTVEGTALTIGSPSFIQDILQLDASVQEKIETLEKTTATTLVVLANEVPIGLIAVKDVVRKESAALLQSLKTRYDMHTVMLTGDNAITADAVGREAGVETVFPELLPNDKMEHIENLKLEYGTVAMVGDGINDAPALALADVGIAMGAASSDTAIQVADVALMANNIEVLPAFFKLSRKVVSTIHVNIAFALSIKIVVMILAIIGVAQMWMAIFADVGVLILVLLYSMRLGLPMRRP